MSRPVRLSYSMLNSRMEERSDGTFVLYSKYEELESELSEANDRVKQTLQGWEAMKSQLFESDHALDCMTSSAGELQDVCDKLEKQLATVRNEHIKIQVKPDGVWIRFKGNRGRESLLNLNNVVNEMNPSGMTQNICAEAIKSAIGEVES